MSQPTPGDVYVSRPLTNVSLAYSQESSYIADKMFPVIPSEDQGGIIYEWDPEYALRNEMKPRAPNAPTAGVGMKINQKTYFTIPYGLHHDIPDQRRANERSPIKSDRAATKLLTDQALQHREILLKSKAFGTGKWTAVADQTGVPGAPAANQFKQWDQSSSTPVKDVRTLLSSAKLAVGVRPNRMAMGQQVWDALLTNPDIIDRIKYGQTGPGVAEVTLAGVAQLFGVKEILISDVVQATSKENAPALVNAYIIGKEFVLFYTPDEPGLEVPSAGYTFTWSGYMGATVLGTRMKKFRIEANAADRIEIEQAYEQNLCAPKLGVYGSAVIA